VRAVRRVCATGEKEEGIKMAHRAEEHGEEKRGDACVDSAVDTSLPVRCSNANGGKWRRREFDSDFNGEAGTR